MQHGEPQQERIVDLDPAFRKALGNVGVVDIGHVDLNVVEKHVAEDEKDQKETRDAHEHPPSELAVGAIDRPRLAQRFRLHRH